MLRTVNQQVGGSIARIAGEVLSCTGVMLWHYRISYCCLLCLSSCVNLPEKTMCVCMHLCVCMQDRTSAVVKEKCTCKKLDTLGHTFVFFPELLLFLLLAFNSTSPPATPPSLVSPVSLLTHAYTHSQTHTHLGIFGLEGSQVSLISGFGYSTVCSWTHICERS